MHQNHLWTNAWTLLKSLGRHGQLMLYQRRPRPVAYKCPWIVTCPYIDESWLASKGVQGDLEKLGREIQTAMEKQPHWYRVRSHQNSSEGREFQREEMAQGNRWCLGSHGLQSVVTSFLNDEIWGIRRKLSASLQSMGIKKAIDLARDDRKSLRKVFNGNVEKTSMELEGVNCYSLEDSPEPKQTIAGTRPFGERVTYLQGLHETVATYASRRAPSSGRKGSSLPVCRSLSRPPASMTSLTAVL